MVSPMIRKLVWSCLGAFSRFKKKSLYMKGTVDQIDHDSHDEHCQGCRCFHFAMLLLESPIGGAMDLRISVRMGGLKTDMGMHMYSMVTMARSIAC